MDAASQHRQSQPPVPTRGIPRVSLAPITDFNRLYDRNSADIQGPYELGRENSISGSQANRGRAMTWTDFLAWVHQWKPHALGTLYNWQTLIAGMLALVGALITVRQIGRQIDQVAASAETQRSREEDAAKAVLPLALSQICQYSADCLQLLIGFVPGRGGAPAVTTASRVPEIPSSAVTMLQTCARHAAPDVVTKIAGLLNKLQVQHARLESLLDRSLGRPMHTSEGLDAMVDAVDIHAKAGALFQYGRNLAELRRRAPADDLRSSLGANGIYEDIHPALYERVATLR
jgi:hypothetical protein